MIKAFVYGNIGNDAEQRTGKNNGTVFLTFSVAETNRDVTTWVNCVAFDQKLIEFNRDKLVKGARVELYGDLRMTTDTKNNTRLELTVRDVVSVYVRDGAARAATAKPAATKTTVRKPAPNLDSEPSDDEEAPF